MEENKLKIKCPRCKGIKIKINECTDALQVFSYEEDFKIGYMDFGMLQSQHGECMDCKHNWKLRKHITLPLEKVVK